MSNNAPFVPWMHSLLDRMKELYNKPNARTIAEALPDITGALHYRGTKATVADLPSSGNATGDVWHITADGSEWAWDGSEWENLGGAVDLSAYRTELTVDTTQDAWSGANWDELIAAAKNGRAVSLGVDGADAQTVLLHYDELANSAEIKIIETEPKIYYYSTLAGAVSDSNAGTVGTNADASQGTAVASLYVDDNGLPNIVLLQNTSITSGLLFERNAVLDLNGHKITAELGNPESHAYAVLVNRGYSLRIKGQTLGSAIESNTGSGPAVTLLYNNVGSYLEVLGGEYTVNAAETTIGACVRNYGNVLLKDMTINATAQKVDGITSGSASGSLRQNNNNIQNVTINAIGLGEWTSAINIQNGESTFISDCQLNAESDTESGKIYGICINNTSKPTIIQNSEIVADSNYHYVNGSYTVLSTGIVTGTMCSYLLLQNCTVKGCHASAELHCSTDIDGGYYSSAGHGVYFSGTDTVYRVKGAKMDDLYVGTHTNTNQNHVGAYIGGSSGATGISVYADDTDVSGSNYSWVLRNSSGESDNALYISNSNINNKTIRIDDDTTLKLYLGEGNTFDADDTTSPANVVETGADYTFTPTATEISYSGQPVTGSLTERDPGSVTIREVSLSANGNVTVTDYELVQKSELSGGGGGSVTVDAALSASSENPVQNKAITSKINQMDLLLEELYTDKLTSFRDLQRLTRLGLASKVLAVGDQIVCERATATSATVINSEGNDGITAATVDRDKFLHAIGTSHNGVYEFYWDGAVWHYGNEAVELSTYGITLTGTPTLGDKIVVHETAVSLVWDVIGIDCDTPADAQFEHSLTLGLHDCFVELQFDPREALFYCEEGLAAGTYNFTVKQHSWVSSDVNKTFQFTLTQAVPAKGQIVLMTAYNVAIAGSTVKTFASATATTEIETATVTEGSAGTSLGDVNDAVNENTNSLQRGLLGSNNADSPMRQYINSSAAAGSVWTPKTKFNRPPSWAATTAGFLNGMDEDFLSVIGEVTKKTALNTVSDGGGSVETTERFFLLSRSEVYGGNEVTGGEGAAYPYYANHSDLAAPGTGNDSNRIKYRNGAAKYWWLRSPSAGNASNVLYVNTTGNVSYNGATNSYGVAPACCII